MSNEPFPPVDTSPVDTSEEEAQHSWDAEGRYWLLGGAALIAGVLLLFELRKGFTWEVIVFAAIALLGGAWALWMATTSVEISDEGLRLKRLVGSQMVKWQQMISVTTQGRFLRVLTILYYPRRENGLVDTDAVRSLLMPSVKNQDELLAALEAKVEQ